MPEIRQLNQDSSEICMITQGSTKPYCEYFYSARSGDTLASIAEALTRHQPSQSREACLQRLIAVNRYSASLSAYLSEAGINRPLPAHSTLAIPLDCVDDPGARGKRSSAAFKASHQHLRQALRRANDIGIPERAMLHQALELIPLPLLSGVSQFVLAMNQFREKHAFSAAVGLVSLEQTGDYLKDTYDEFLEHTHQVNESLNRYISASLEEKAPLRQAFLESQRELNQKFERLLIRLAAKTPNSGAAKFLSARELYWDARVNPNNYRVLNARELDAITHLIRRARFIGRGALAVEVTLGGMDVYSAYAEHKDWRKKLAEVLGEIGGGVTGGFLFVWLNPFTASAIITIGLGITGTVLFGQGAKHLIDLYWPETKLREK